MKIRPDNRKEDYFLIQGIDDRNINGINLTPDTVVAVFKNTDGSYWVCSICDLVEAGTPIDPETGDDLEYIGQAVRRADIEVS